MIVPHLSLKSLVLTCTLLLFAGSASGQDIQKIAAIVNDEIISGYDLSQRISLTIVMSGFPNTQETRNQLVKPTLTRLIDDRLKLQEAKKNNLTASDAEAAKALENFEKLNNIAPGELDRKLEALDVDVETLLEQIRVNLAWNKVIQRRVMPRITISDEEIQAVQEKLEANRGKNEYLLSEIYLPVETGANEKQVRAGVMNLVKQLRNGTPFARAAAQFSQGATASGGGSIGWVLVDDVEPEITKILPSLRENEISDPIRTTDGYFIVTIDKIRTVLENNPDDIIFDLTQLVIPLNSASNNGQSPEILAKTLSNFIDTCSYMPELVTEITGPGSGKLGKIRLGDLPDNIKPLLINMKAGEASAPYLDEDAYRIFIVCDRDDPNARSSSSEAIRREILIRRTENRARGYFQDIYNSATIDRR